jgi:hypothetical protein
VALLVRGGSAPVRSIDSEQSVFSSSSYQTEVFPTFNDNGLAAAGANLNRLARRHAAAGERLDAYIRANTHRIRAGATTPGGEASGQAHDLEAILRELVAAHCPEVTAPSIAWGASRASRRRGRMRTIRLGVYRYDARSIHIHPCLDAAWVPRYFVAWVVFHELMHHVAPGPEAGGRRLHHHDDFRALEARFPEREMALAWERASVVRAKGVERTPSVGELAKKACSTGARAAGGANADTCTAGRPFFMRMGVVHTSREPAANSASINGAINWPAMSSMLASRSSTSSDDVAGSADSGCPASTRNTLGRSAKSFVPAP